MITIPTTERKRENTWKEANLAALNDKVELGKLSELQIMSGIARLNNRHPLINTPLPIVLPYLNSMK